MPGETSTTDTSSEDNDTSEVTPNIAKVGKEISSSSPPDAKWGAGASPAPPNIVFESHDEIWFQKQRDLARSQTDTRTYVGGASKFFGRLAWR